jgi:hypothetical protein
LRCRPSEEKPPTTHAEPAAADNSNESETANARLDYYTCLGGELLSRFLGPRCRVDLASLEARIKRMDKTKTVELTGRAGNWVALKGNSYEVVAEGRTLKEVAGKARRLGIKNPTFARIPRKDCALIL